jgi:hypothetical protein
MPGSASTRSVTMRSKHSCWPGSSSRPARPTRCGVLAELGVPGPSRVTLMRCLKRVIERDYQTMIAKACYAHAIQQGGLALVLYDLTTLYFESAPRGARFLSLAQRGPT